MFDIKSSLNTKGFRYRTILIANDFQSKFQKLLEKREMLI